MPRIDEGEMTGAGVDVVISAYNEEPEDLALTLRSCFDLAGVGNVVVVDDGSDPPISLPQERRRLSMFRLARNSGISVARNEGIARTASRYVACVNSDIELEPDWLDATTRVLDTTPTCGAVFTKTRLPSPVTWLTRWRTAYHELPTPPTDGPEKFAPGHAVLFRRAALDQIGGYDPRYTRCREDVDVCKRLEKAGWSTMYTSRSACISHQVDSVGLLGRKTAVRALHCGNDPVPLLAGFGVVLQRTCYRVASSVWHHRWAALAVEPLITPVALWEVVKMAILSETGNRP
jgi:GT2 family glycosyltransferase